MSFALDIENLACVRGGRMLFEDVRLSLGAGACAAVTGANGAGKTSLLRILAGLLPPVSGIIRVRTESGAVATAPEDRALLVGWLGERDAVKGQLTVAEQLSFWSRLYGGGKPDPAGFGLDRLADVPGQLLSAGQKRRLALARLTLSGRRLWLLDEPLGALDVAGKALVSEAVRAHCAAGGIAVAAGHEPLGVENVTLKLGAP